MTIRRRRWPYLFNQGGFNPLLIPNLALWLDASDSSTITLDGSSNIEQLRDKSGNSRHANQGVALRRPSVSAINGVQAASFDATDDFMTVLNGSWADLPSYSIYGIVRPTNTGATYRAWVGKENSAADRKFFLGNNISVGLLYSSAAAVDSINIDTGSVYTNGVGVLISAHKNGNTNARAFVNGTLLSTDAAVTTGVSPADIYIGAGAAGGYLWPGQIGEFLIYADNHDDTTRGLIQNYLAEKWLGSVGGVLAPALWLDASDTSTITLDGSNNVSEWRDKSKNARHAVQATALNKPTWLSNQLNGLGAIKGNGTSHFLETSAMPTLENGYTVLAVQQSIGAGNAAVASMSAAVFNGAMVIGAAGGVSYVSQWGFSISQAAPAVNTNFGKLAKYDGSHPTGNYRIRLSTQAADTTGTMSQTAGTPAAGPLRVLRADTTYSDKNLYELIVFPRQTTVAEDNLLKAYVTAKWGITWS